MSWESLSAPIGTRMGSDFQISDCELDIEYTMVKYYIYHIANGCVVFGCRLKLDGTDTFQNNCYILKDVLYLIRSILFRFGWR
jgi:hypothetical protein